MTVQRNRLQLDAFLPFRLSVLSNIVSNAIAAQYARRFRLSIPEWRVVAVLALRPGLSAAEVAARTAMDKVAVSRAVASLLHAGRLERRVASGDRRRSVLALSRTGEAVYARVVPVALDYETSLLRPLSAADRAALDRLLRALLDRATELGPARDAATDRGGRRRPLQSRGTVRGARA
jgi:DNA-binding MarR family transcriptional regulator